MRLTSCLAGMSNPFIGKMVSALVAPPFKHWLLKNGAHSYFEAHLFTCQKLNIFE